MAKTMERLDKFHKAILQYIKKNPETTQKQIVDAMGKQKICSMMTTLRKLDELIEMQEIKDLLKKGESGFHRFRINEDNEFRRIDSALEDIFNLGNLTPPLTDKSTEEDIIRYELVCLIFLFLLNQTSHKVSSEKDKRVLYDKIIELILSYSTNHEVGLALGYLIAKSSRLIKSSKSPDAEAFREILEDFYQKFLSKRYEEILSKSPDVNRKIKTVKQKQSE